MVSPCLTQNYGKQPDNSDTSFGPMLIPAIAATLRSASDNPACHGKTNGTDRMTLVPVAFTTEQTPKFNADCALTLTKQSPSGGGQPQAVAFQPRIARNGRGNMGDVCNALQAQSGRTGKGDAAPCVAMINMQGSKGNAVAQADGPSYSLNAMHGHDVHAIAVPTEQAYKVRRLTPTECLRLQNFPDNWFDGLNFSDSVKYRCLGNAVCVAVIEWIACRIGRLG
jgi:DNA (cytosine-5)-methyltransferase 1